MQGAVETTFFTVIIDTDAATPSQLQIFIQAHSSNDGNPADTAIADIVSGTGGFSDDMESGIGGWTYSAHWQISDWDASSPSHSWYCGNSNEMLYGNNWDDTLVSPWIVVPPDGWVVIHHRYNVEENYDYCYIGFDTGLGWADVDTFSGTSVEWERYARSLFSLSPGDTFRIRFRFHSDNGVRLNGWWIDDVYVGPLPPADLYGPRIFPKAAMAGDSITFSIIYQRDDGTYPSQAVLHIGDSVYNVTTADLDPSDGALYSCKIPLSAWNYSHHYEFTVPEGIVRFPKSGEIAGPYVNDTFAVYWALDFNSRGTGSGCWEWGIPTSGPGTAHSGSKLWATVLDGNYPNNNVSILVLDPLDLSEYTHPYLQFWCWYSLQADFDRKYRRDVVLARIITASGDTIFINPLYEYPGYSSSSQSPPPVNGLPSWGDSDEGNFWHLVQFDLEHWAGDTVQLRLDFGSNGSTNNPGFYLDDIMLLTEYNEPAILSFSLNGADSATVFYNAFQRGQYVFAGVNDSIAVVNHGNVSLDFAMKMFWWDSTYFVYADSSCYGCFSIWAQFTDSLPQPDSASYLSPDNWISPDSLVHSDSIHYGSAGWNLLPLQRDFLWFIVRTPEFFPYDTLKTNIFFKAMQHIE